METKIDDTTEEIQTFQCAAAVAAVTTKKELD